MKIRPVLAFALALPVLVLALAAARPQEKKPAFAGGTYQVDTVHSTVGFKVMHKNLAWAFGRFNDFTGSFTIDPAKPETSMVDVKIDVSTIDTKNKKRDDHLRSPDFFDVKQFPDATFKSTSVKSSGANKYAVTGDLTLHGVTKPVTMEVEHTGSAEGQKGGKMAGFHGTFTIKRSDFGIKFMTDALGDEVHMVMSIEGASRSER